MISSALASRSPCHDAPAVHRECDHRGAAGCRERARAADADHAAIDPATRERSGQAGAEAKGRNEKPGRQSQTEDRDRRQTRGRPSAARSRDGPDGLCTGSSRSLAVRCAGKAGRTGAACLGVYTRGGTVFNAATTDWAHGLKGEDATVIRITKNVLDRLSK